MRLGLPGLGIGRTPRGGVGGGAPPSAPDDSAALSALYPGGYTVAGTWVTGVVGKPDAIQGTAANQPSVSSGIPNFDGSNDDLSTQVPVANSTAGTLICVFNASAVSAPGANVFENTVLMLDSGTRLGLMLSTSGLQGFIFDGAIRSTTAIPFLLNTWLMAALRWNSTTMTANVGATKQSTTSGAVPADGGTMVIGTRGGTQAFSGLVRREVFLPAAISDAELAARLAYYASQGDFA